MTARINKISDSISVMELSQDELSFSFLIESHDVACRCLSGLSLAAVKDNNPTDWKEKVCACFAAGVKRHVREHFQNSQPLTDTYAVCRLMQCRINDVAKYCGGDLLDPRKKERFSLQVQGVKTARNLAFHNEFVSVREVYSSIHMLRSVLATIRGNGNLFTEEMKELLALSESVRKLMSSDPGGEFMLSASTIGRALLYTSFREFRKRFSEYFGGNERAATDLREDRNDDSDEDHNHIPNLIKRMRGKVHQIRLCKVLKKRAGEGSTHYTKNDCVVLCKRLLAARNAFAHSEDHSLSWIEQTLLDIKDLLAVLGLPEAQTTFSVGRLESLEEGFRRKVCCILKEGEIVNTIYCPQEQQRERILRPRSKLFVGRTRELSSITSVFRLQRHSRSVERRAVLLFGQSGIGKTFLAIELAHILLKSYRQQIWLTCSDRQELDREISCNERHLLQQGRQDSKTDDTHAADTSFTFSGMEYPHEEKGKLLILDDVTTSTVGLVYDKILKGSRSCIITTRSTAVKNTLQKLPLLLHLYHLQPFSTDESLELIDAKCTYANFRSIPGCLPSVTSSLNNILGNLPLCVGIYSSFLAFSTKKASSHDMSALSTETLLLNWKGIEEEFGDSLHVRGLTGVVQCSECYLEDHPLVVFLLAKICSCNTETVQWAALRHPESTQPELPTCFFAHCTTQWSRELLSGLLGVADWLFSPQAESILNICRDTLEELGLISWETSTATIHIHCLILDSVQAKLKEKNLFLGGLASKAGVSSGDFKFKKEVEVIFKRFSYELQWRVLMQSLAFFANVFASATEYDIITLLQTKITAITCLERSVSDHVKDTLRSSKVATRKLQENPFPGLFNQNIVSLPAILLELGQLWQNLTPPQDRMLTNYGLTWQLAIAMRHVEYAFNRSHSPHEEFYRHLQHVEALIHCSRAVFLEYTFGSSDRRDYMWQASQACPILSRLPNVDDVLELMVKLRHLMHKTQITFAMKRPVKEIKYQLSDDQIKVGIWYYLVHFEITDSIASRHTMSSNIVQIVLCLISYVQQRKQLFISTIQKLPQKARQAANSLWHFQALDYVIGESFMETWFWEQLGKNGRSLRAFMDTFQVIKTSASNFSSFDKDVWLQYFGDHLIMLVVNASLKAYYIGNFAAGMKLSKQLVELFNSSNTHPGGTESFGDRDANLKGCSIGVALFESVWLLYNKKDFSGALTQLRTYLESLPLQTHHGFLYDMVLLPNIMFCPLLGKAITTETLSTLQIISQNCSLPVQRKAETEKISATISYLVELSNPPLENILQHFNEAKDAHKLCAHDSAVQSAALKCFRAVAMSSEELSNCRAIGLFQILNSLLIDVADVLRQVYLNDKKFESVEWFLKFRCKRASYFGWSFLVGKYGFEYVEFLNEIGQLTQAQTLSDNIESFLVDEFGDDYMDWLPDTSNIRPAKDENENNSEEEMSVRRC